MRSVSAYVMGLAVCAVVALLGHWLAELPPLRHVGIDGLTVSIALGLLLGNLAPVSFRAASEKGVGFSQRVLLEVGIALFGLHLTLQQIVAVGSRGILVDLLVVGLILSVGLVVGIRMMKLDRDTVLLVTLGSAICGAAAVMGAAPVIRASPHKTAIAVATVTVFGTCAIFLYPMLYPYLGISPEQFGVFVGSTVHSVSQVVAAASPVSLGASDEAMVVKLIRVLFLAPVLLVVSRIVARDQGSAGSSSGTPALPCFVAAFALIVGLNSIHVLPASFRHSMIVLDDWLLALAMAALGWSTSAAMLKRAGFRPLSLGAVLFAFLVVGGLLINHVV